MTIKKSPGLLNLKAVAEKRKFGSDPQLYDVQEAQRMHLEKQKYGSNAGNPQARIAANEERYQELMRKQQLKNLGVKRVNAIRIKPKPPARRDSFGFEPEADYQKRVKKVAFAESGSSTLKRQSRVTGPRPGFTSHFTSQGLIKLKATPTPIKYQITSNSRKLPSLEDIHGHKISLYGGHQAPPEKVSRLIQARNLTGQALHEYSTRRFEPIDKGVRGIQAIDNIIQGKKPIQASATRTFNLQAKVGNALAQFFLVANVVRGAYEEYKQGQKNIQQVLNEEDRFEQLVRLETKEDPTTGVITQFQKVAEPPKAKLYSIEAFEKDYHRWYSNLNINPFSAQYGKYQVTPNMVEKMDTDYHWSYMKELPKDGGEGRIIAKAHLYDNEPDYYFIYNEKAVEPKGGELVRYVGIPTLVNDQKKIEWFRYSLRGDTFTSDFGHSGLRLQNAFTGEWNDGNTSKKPLGLTIDQWLSQHGQEAEAYQTYLNPTQDPEQPDTEQEYIALLNVYLETVASDPASVYLYLQSITPPLEATVFEKVWAEYNQWRIQRGLLVVSHDNLEQTQPEPVETQSQIQQSNVIAGEGVTPLSSVFGSLYKEQNIRFERQFK